MQPSPPGYDFTAADLASADIDRSLLARLIVAPQTVPAAQVPDPLQLLAALLKTQKRNSAAFRPVPFNFATFARQMMLADNPNRSYLLIQNVGSGDVMVVFENGPVSVQDLSAAGDQSQLTAQQTRAVRIVAGGYFEPLVVPINAVTLFTLNTATNGLIIEGQ